MGEESPKRGEITASSLWYFSSAVFHKDNFIFFSFFFARIWAILIIEVVLQDHKCTVEYYVTHFLVHESKARVGRKRVQTLRIDTMDKGSSRWKGAEILVFNTAHWWNHYKTKAG